MNIEVVKGRIEGFVAAGEVELSAVIDEVLKLYADIRVLDTSLEEDGDMLLFQWGTYDGGAGSYFELDITRQVIFAALEDGGSEEGIRQLNVTFRYLPTESSGKLKNGNAWCETPLGLAEFRSAIFESSAYQWCGNEKPLSMVVNLGTV